MNYCFNTGVCVLSMGLFLSHGPSPLVCLFAFSVLLCLLFRFVFSYFVFSCFVFLRLRLCLRFVVLRVGAVRRWADACTACERWSGGLAWM